MKLDFESVENVGCEALKRITASGPCKNSKCNKAPKI